MSQYRAIKARRAAYSVDLSGHVHTCELNYQRLLSMLPGLRDGTEHWQFEAGDKAAILINVELKESAPYTSVVEIKQQREGMTLPSLQLRICHDAAVAEVIVFEGHRHWQSRYEYPNKRMYHRDEKLELNRFLYDWLVFCRSHGLMQPSNCDLVPIQAKR
ncbi:DUF1249 domain-containing protein [Agaribacterium haliotis]|uniref:DUF1249 domain-containing protein n=1 Tax=Agaribacterium haliotis TaxID=2013869 RepID=UPI000BB59D1D|nr:DUF1249 domain-containing protein [Agaribacterium haliotis]